MRIKRLQKTSVHGLQQTLIEFDNGLILTNHDERLLFQIQGDYKWWPLSALSAHNVIHFIKIGDEGEPMTLRKFATRLERTTS